MLSAIIDSYQQVRNDSFLAWETLEQMQERVVMEFLRPEYRIKMKSTSNKTVLLPNLYSCFGRLFFKWVLVIFPFLSENILVYKIEETCLTAISMLHFVCICYFLSLSCNDGVGARSR